MENGLAECGDISAESCEPYIIINSKFCKVLDNKNGMKECEISKLDEILKTKSVSCLDLSGCLFLEFPPNFCNLGFITELNLSGNKLQTLPEEFINFNKLRVLNISNNLFNELPSALYDGLYLVKVLNISNNSIVTIMKAPCCLPKLQHLDLSSNRLCAPPCWLNNDIPTSLEYIDLSFNPCFDRFMETRNSSTSNKVADNIKTLKISNCMFREGNSSYLLNFSRLHTLLIGNDLSKSKFCNYVSELKNLPNSIEKLQVSNIGLVNVSKSITCATNLRHLDISNNMIHWLPMSVNKLKALVTLQADSCNLCLLPIEMNELISLKELYLSSNQLSSLEGFENLTNLEVLDLYGNQLICLPNLQKFSKLVALDLCQNYIEPPTALEVDHIKYSYEDLKSCLRSKILKPNRKDGAKDFPTIPEDELCDDVSDYSFEDTDYVDAGSGDIPLVENGNIGVDDFQDFWEEDENETFDPNVWTGNHRFSCLTRTESCESLTGETPYEVTTHPHYFTPFQLVSPIIVCKTSLPPPVEGQFDD